MPNLLECIQGHMCTLEELDGLFMASVIAAKEVIGWIDDLLSPNQSWIGAASVQDCILQHPTVSGQATLQEGIVLYGTGWSCKLFP